MSVQTDAELARRYLLNGETAEGLTIIRHDEHTATPTYMLSMSIGWADTVIAERMYLDDARGIAHALAEVLDCVVSGPDEDA